MIHTKQYIKAFVVTRPGMLVAELPNFSSDDISGLRAIVPFISSGDILRCFTEIGLVDTYVIRIEKYRNWPTIISLQDITEQKKAV
ncbi:MAG: hypothetical protein ACOC7X_04415 [Spirochaetota bacterium]